MLKRTDRHSKQKRDCQVGDCCNITRKTKDNVNGSEISILKNEKVRRESEEKEGRRGDSEKFQSLYSYGGLRVLHRSSFLEIN